jgi:hypothetical protein
MIVPPPKGLEFVRWYTQVLLSIYHSAHEKPLPDFKQTLVAGRTMLVDNPSLLARALDDLEAQSTPLPEEIIHALENLEFANWIYLKDTRSYSVFMHPDQKRAYGVLGLTERFRDIIGGSGSIVGTAVLPFWVLPGKWWIGGFRQVFSAAW